MRIVALLVVVLVGSIALLRAAPPLLASDNSTVTYGSTQTITAFGVCKKITNNSSTGKSVYVPTQSAAEWQSFQDHLPAGVTTASCVIPGVQTFTAAGAYTFTVPAFNSLTVQVWGAGGGGAGGVDYYGSSTETDGGASSFDSYVIAIGGTAGHWLTNTAGSGGTASGGTLNEAGSAGSSSTGKGGNAAGGGGTGGSGGAFDFIAGCADGASGISPGGGGGGGGTIWQDWWAGSGAVPGLGGGGGGYATRTYASGQLLPGSTVSVVVGLPGAAGTFFQGWWGEGTWCTGNGGAGGVGRVTISWN